MSQQAGFDKAPDHYAGKRETIDKQRDAVSDLEFASHCFLCVMKYLSRAGKKQGQSEAKDLGKARWYRQMQAHVLSGDPDPRAGRADFVPYARQPTDMASLATLWVNL